MACARSPWQPYRVEVWSEKGTVRGTIAPVLDEYGVTFRVMHGFASATALYSAVAESQLGPLQLVVFYVGDWDPSGLYMSARDIPARLTRYGGGEVLYGRIALTAAHIRNPDLPSFAADTKRTDTRWRWFRTRYGERCWELDALNPVVLRADVEQAIRDYIDGESWERCALAEEAERKLSDAPSVFACALDSAVEGLEQLYLLLDELEALLREEPRQAPGGQGDQGGDREACSHNPEETSA